MVLLVLLPTETACICIIVVLKDLLYIYKKTSKIAKKV